METIKPGSNHPDVLYLQRLLGATPDGKYGPKTEAVVKEWQKSKGLVPDGVVGPKTWAEIMYETRRPITDITWEKIAASLGCEVATLKAIKSVETGSKGPYLANSGRPAILFEAHLFWKNLKAVGKNPEVLRKTHPGILSPSWNKALYKGGESEYTRLVEAWNIHPEAAIKSTSWGFPQILGQNFRYPFEFVADSYVSEELQAEYFGRFLADQGFRLLLQKKDWAGIACRYNGPGYKANRYDQKLAEAYRKLVK